MRQGGTYAVAGAVALVIHVGLGASLAGVNPKDWASQSRTNVELEVIEPPPPPPPPEPTPPPPPPPKQPRLAMRRPVQTPPPEAPKPPPSEEPPKEDPTPPNFGVSLDSTVSGESSMAVPVGDTVATNDRTPRKSVPAPGPPGPPAFAPVPEAFVAQPAQILERDPREARKEVFPEEARRLNMEGSVLLRLGIDRTGSIRSVKVIKAAGYGFDEAAVQSIKRYKWAPARDNNGRPVDIVITFRYTFAPPN